MQPSFRKAAFKLCKNIAGCARVGGVDKNAIVAAYYGVNHKKSSGFAAVVAAANPVYLRKRKQAKQ